MLALVLAVVAAYAPALVHGGFVFDDHPLVLENPLLRGPLSAIWFTTRAPDYLPLTWTSLWIEWRIWGTDPWGYHVTNVLLHLTAAILVWRVLWRLGVPGAWLAGLIFAVHPAAVESVAWVSERKNTLSALPFAAALLAWIRFVDARRGRDLALSLLMYACALLAKASVVPLPIVLAGIHLHRRGRMDRSCIASLTPFVGLASIAGTVTIWFQRHNAMDVWSESRGLLARVGGAGWALVSYLQKAFVPANLGFVYAPWPPDPSLPWSLAPWLLLAAIAAVAWHQRARWGRPVLWALGYHAAMVLPVLGLVNMAYLRVGPVANHLQYLALAGPVAVVARGIRLALDGRRRAFAGATMAIAALLVMTTAHRAAAFEDDLTLWRAAVADAPESTFARRELAIALAEHGMPEESLRQLEEMARVARDPATRHHARSLSLLASGRASEAAVEAEQAVRLRQDSLFRYYLGVALTQAGRGREAVEALRPLARAAPLDIENRYWLAMALAQAGELQEAAAELEDARRVMPDDPRLADALSEILARMRAGAAPGGPPNRR